MRHPTLRSLAFAAVALAPALAAGHTVMIDPQPRDLDQSQIKAAPCGVNTPGVGVRSDYVAGSTITVQFNEYIEHPGYHRIAFSMDGVNGFDDNVLVPMIADVVMPDTNPLPYLVQVTLPNTPCDNCSIQMQSCMDGTMPPIAACAANSYYSCADIRLLAADGDGGAIIPPDAGPGAPDGGAGGPDGGNAVDDGFGDAPGLCALGGPSGHSPWSAGLLALFILVSLAVRPRLARERNTRG
jgi:hypothetical protein